MTLDNPKFIQKLQNRDFEAFKVLHDNYASKMKFVCLRYLKNDQDAEDTLQEGFINIFKNINQYSGKGSFEGWIKKTFINLAINKCKRDSTFLSHQDLGDMEHIADESNENNQYEQEDNKDYQNITLQQIEQINFTESELTNLLNNIPDHFRIVFSMYVIDDYKHKDIAELLNINEKTSKTRLSRARKLLQTEVLKFAAIKLQIPIYE